MFKKKLKYLIKRILQVLTIIYLFIFILSCVFAYLPVPFSSFMLQQYVVNKFSGTTYQQKNTWVELDKISPYIQLAVIASEDQNFSAHYGFSFQDIKQAFKHNQKSKKTRGASTISQQTVKNLYLFNKKGWSRKVVEVPITATLEFLWKKSRILTVYLNIIQFGDGIYGVEAASQHYFKKSAKNLTQAESALLAAVLPNPKLLKVSKPSNYVLKRQKHILKQMNFLSLNYLKKID